MTRMLRIAVADDEPDVLDYFRVMLPRLGHLVVATARNGRELMELCREHNPDLIIADMRMPEMNGDVAIQEICQDNPTPFILISAYIKPAGMPAAINLSGQVYLTKPVKLSDLKHAIEQVCPPHSGHE